MISIVIATYMQAQSLAATLDSVLAQNIEECELLVCDDASTDATPTIVAAYQAEHPQIHVIRHQTRQGLARTINHGLSRARGEYVLVLRAGEALLPGALLPVLSALHTQPDVGYIVALYAIERAGGQAGDVRELNPVPGDELAALFTQSVALGSTLFRRAALAARADFLDQAWASAQDETLSPNSYWDVLLGLRLQGVVGCFSAQVLSRSGPSPALTMLPQAMADSQRSIAAYLHLLERYGQADSLPLLAATLTQILSELQNAWLAYQDLATACARQPDPSLRQRLVDVAASLSPSLGLTAEVALAPPLFSVILTTYKRPQLLQSALASILAQTCQDFEILLVNDGGVPVESVLEWSQRDARITYIRQPNRGPSAARNAALKLAIGQYIVYLDDDDLMRPKHLETLRDQLAVTPDAVVYTSAEYVTEDLSAGLRTELKRYNPFAHEAYDKRRLQVCNYIPINTFCHARSLLELTGLFDESLLALEDWDLLLRLSRLVPFVHVNRLTVEVRQRSEDKGSHQTGRQYEQLHAIYQQLYQRYDDLDEPMVRVGRAAILSAEHPAQASLVSLDYQRWLDMFSLREVDAEILAERMVREWHAKPMLTMVMKVPQSRLDALGASLQSLQQQLYQHWRLVVIADYPSPDPIFTSTDLLGWLQVEALDDDELFARALNVVVTDLPGDWLTLLPPGTELSADCLLRLADCVQQKDQCVALYTDSDQLMLPGCYAHPAFKPDFNLEYLLSWDYIGAACWFNQQAIMNVGGFAAFPGKEGYELLLRLVDRYGEQTVAHLPYPLHHLPQVQASALATAAQQVAIQNHLARQGREAQVLVGHVPDTFQIVYPIQGQPLVSIIIPSRDKLEFIQPCITTLFEKTAYTAFEVLIVDNQSQDPDVLDYYHELETRYPGQVRILHYDAPFNFSAQCNLGASQAQGDYLLLLNNDIEIIQPEWLERLLMHAQRTEVGICGAKLVYPETGKVQHAGILLGGGTQILSLAVHYGTPKLLDDAGYMNRLQCDMYLSALTGACMMVRREVYRQVGGYNEELSVLFNDVDFCLRVSQAGYKLQWTPYSVLVHHHGMSVNSRLVDPIEQGRFAAQSLLEHRYMFEHWLPELAHDAAYNRHLSLHDHPLEIDYALVCSWEPAFKERPKILGAAIGGGSGEYRLLQPLWALSVAGQAQVCCLHLSMNQNLMPKVLEIARLDPDVIVTQNPFNDMHLETAKWYRSYFPEKLYVSNIDDLLTDLPEKSSLYKHIKANFRDARRRVRESMAMVDRVVVSTEPLAEFVREWIDDVHLVPNRLVKSKWTGLVSKRGAGPRPRVGWVGAQQHGGDLEIIHDVIRELADEVDWVFMGMWPKELAHLIKEKRSWVAFNDYPATMAGLNLDLAIAPLEINAFNESKSNLRLLEYGAMGWPVVCSDIVPYQTNHAPVKRVPNTREAWLTAIRERIADRDAAYREGDALRDWVLRHYLLEDHLDEWLRAYSR